MLRVAVAAALGAVLVVLLAADGRASLLHPEDTISSVPVGEDGTPSALPWSEFARRRLILRNAGLPTRELVEVHPQTKQPVIDPKTGQPRLSERGELDARIKREQKKRAEDRTPEEGVALAVDLLRFGKAEEAESVLRGHRRGFLPNVTLAHIAATQGQWARAYDFLDIANSERPPAALPGTSPKKLAWQLALNRGALTKLIRLRLAESRGPKPSPEDELPDRLFDANFVNDAGVYEPGVVAAAERAKLPPDAVATVQQLVLWFPYDVRLYWLLAELYAARGEFAAAEKIMDECAWTLTYSNRKALMQHREAVIRAAKAMKPAADEPLLAPPEAPPPEPPEQPPPVPFTISAVWWYFGGVAAIALFALVRTLTKKGKGGGGACGPVG